MNIKKGCLVLLAMNLCLIGGLLFLSQKEMDALLRRSKEGDAAAREQLIAYNRTVDEIKDIIGADSLGYLKMERLQEMVNGLNICTGCFNGIYPLEPPAEDIRGEFDK